MSRRGLSDAQREASARQAALRTIARGEQPLYRVRITQDGTWAVDWCPWLSIDATDRGDAMAEARTSVAGWLGVSPSTFDVEVA
jgi:hypothetical protein